MKYLCQPFPFNRFIVSCFLETLTCAHILHYFPTSVFLALYFLLWSSEAQQTMLVSYDTLFSVWISSFQAHHGHKHHEFIFSQIFTRRMQTCDHSLGLNSVSNRHIVGVHDAKCIRSKRDVSEAKYHRASVKSYAKQCRSNERMLHQLRIVGHVVEERIYIW
jgi:hypothetical protein